MVNEKSPTLPKEVVDAIERDALVNASRHGGKADTGAVVGMVLAEFPSARASAEDVKSKAKASVEMVNGMTAAQQAEALRSRFPGSPVEAPRRVEKRQLPPLPRAEKGRASFRLPPEPSGFMTIGHAMAFTINHLYSEMYDGELWLRFEDTNPKKAAKRFYDNFREGVAWLGITPDHEKNLSDDNELIYGYGRKLLEKGEAYACSCDQPLVKKNRFEGRACLHRSQNIEVNLRVWEEMLAKKHREGAYVIRLKGDMGSLDYSLRDPNIFRIIEHEHPITGSRYAVWPTYNLANTVEDQLCGITHILRSTEFPVALQELLRKKLSFRNVEVIQFSRFNFKGTPVAKRLLRPLVDEGLVSGWDDPRMPTVDGIKRRGILPEAIRQFTLQVGYTKAEHEFDWSLLFAVNRKLLDPRARRIFFVPSPVRLTVKGAPEKAATIPFHPDRDLGKRTIETSGDFFVPRDDVAGMARGTVFRLMDLYNLELTSSGDSPTARYVGDELLDGTKKLQWVTPDHVETEVIVADLLFGEDGKFNPSSLKSVAGYAEKAVTDVKLGEVFQFPRFGFCRLDSPGRLILAHR